MHTNKDRAGALAALIQAPLDHGLVLVTRGDWLATRPPVLGLIHGRLSGAHAALRCRWAQDAASARLHAKWLTRH
jgi:hypothetical protein